MRAVVVAKVSSQSKHECFAHFCPPFFKNVYNIVSSKSKLLVEVTMNYTKVCSKCQQEKPANLEYFTKRGEKLGSHCRECKKQYKRNPEYRKKHYENNKQKYLDKAREWAENNKERRREICNDWYHRNKDKANDYIKQKRKSDPLFRLKHSLRANLNNALRGRSKGQRTLDYLCMSIDEFKTYIENQFTEGMNWENYGEWHLDHIQPICSFDHSDEEQIKKCWHYSNFQPLWAEENIKKSGKY